MSEKCIGCNFMTADLVCLLDGELKDDIQLNKKVSDCNVIKSYNRADWADKKQTVISFAADVTNDDKKFSANISHDKNKLILEFKGTNIPFPLLSKANFNVKIHIPTEQVDCNKDCDKCLTPIC